MLYNGDNEELGGLSGRIYRRLDDLEQTTRTIVAQKSKTLSPELGSFSEIDAGESATFEFVLDGFKGTDVLCISLISSPSYMCEEFLSGETTAWSPKKKVEMSPTDSQDDIGNDEDSPEELRVVLTRNSSHEVPSTVKYSTNMQPKIYGKTAQELASSKSQSVQRIEYQPKYHRGEYTFALTRNHGVTSGSYSVTVANGSESTPYSIKVTYSVIETVRATAVHAHEKVFGFVSAEEV